MGRYTRKTRLSRSEQRKRAQDRLGYAMLSGCALITGGLLWAAYTIDKANGITVGQSLAMWGL